MTTLATENRVRQVLDAITADALSIFEQTLRERGATPDETAEAMTARRARLDKWSAVAFAGIMSDIAQRTSTERESRKRELYELKREQPSLRADIAACMARLDMIEQIVVADRPLPN